MGTEHFVAISVIACTIASMLGEPPIAVNEATPCVQLADTTGLEEEEGEETTFLFL